MIHTERGRLTELIEFMEADRLFVAEVLGVGPSGQRSRVKTLLNNPTRLKKFEDRLKAQDDILAVLRGML
jgi:hypothetical protein